MKIGIITVYEPTTNLGSFLQAFALQKVLKSYGYDVYIVQSHSTCKSIAKVIFKINPKREFFFRLKRAKYSEYEITDDQYAVVKAYFDFMREDLKCHIGLIKKIWYEYVRIVL